ncbi:helix-turn-helix transcriptional regulator [Pseudolactococcus yaeyamensis]
MTNEELARYVGSKIREYRKQKGWTQNELANKLGINKTTVSNYEVGFRTPRQKLLFKIADIFGVSINDIFPSIHGKERKTTLPTPDNISETTKILDNIFVNLDKSNQALLIKNAKELFEKQNKEKIIEIHEKSPKYEISEPALVEVIGHSQVAAGLGYGYDDEDNYTVYTDRDDLPCYDLATMVSGKSMEPEYPSGEMLLLRDLGTTSYNGELCVIADDDKSYFKKLYTEDDQLRLVSLNPEYDDIIIPFPPDEGSHIKIFSVVDSFEPVEY